MIETNFGPYEIVHCDDLTFEDNIITMICAVAIPVHNEAVKTTTDLGIFEAQRVTTQPQPVVFPELKMSSNYAFEHVANLKTEIEFTMKQILDNTDKTEENESGI